MGVTIQPGSYAQWAGTLESVSPFGHNIPVTVASGSNSLLACVITSDLQNLADLTVKFNNVVMTGLYAQSSGSGARNMIFYMLAPPVGTFNLFVGVSGWWGQNVAMRGLVFDGVNQSTPFGTPVSDNNAFGTSPLSVSITALASEMLLSIFGTKLASTITPSAGETAFAATLTEGNANISSMLAYKAGGATSSAMTFTNAGQPALLAVVVKAAVAAAPGSGAGTPAALSVTSPTAVAGTGAAAGTITTPPLKNNAGTLLASIPGWTVNVFSTLTGALVVQKTGLSTNASGVLAISDPAIVAGTTYAYEPSHATYGRRLPVGVAS